jgi:hypothetical protein
LTLQLANFLQSTASLYLFIAILVGASLGIVTRALIAANKVRREIEALTHFNDQTSLDASSPLSESYARLQKLKAIGASSPITPPLLHDEWLADELLERYARMNEHDIQRQASNIYVLGLAFTLISLIAAVVTTLNDIPADPAKLTPHVVALLRIGIVKFCISVAGVLLGLGTLWVCHLIKGDLRQRLATLRGSLTNALPGGDSPSPGTTLAEMQRALDGSLRSFREFHENVRQLVIIFRSPVPGLGNDATLADLLEEVGKLRHAIESLGRTASAAPRPVQLESPT